MKSAKQMAQSGHLQRELYSSVKGAKASLAAGGEPAGEAHRSREAGVVPAEALGFGREGPRVLQAGLG